MRGVIFFIFYFIINSNSLIAQTSLLDSVMVKFHKDQRAIKEFCVLGKMYCVNKIITNSDVYFQTYARIRISSPFSILISEERLKQSFENVIQTSNIDFKFETEFLLQKNNSHYYTLLTTIDRIWKPKNIKKEFRTLIKNKLSYIQAHDVNGFNDADIVDYMRNYINNYFIDFHIGREYYYKND